MEHMGDSILYAVLILAAVFVPLSLGAFLIKKIVLAVQRRRRRQAAERIMNAPLVAGDYRFRSVAPRVLHVPSHDPHVERARAIPRVEPEDDRESDLIVPMIVTEALIEQLRYASVERPAVFAGKGGQSGGAGASDTWEEPASEPETVEEPESSSDESSESESES